MRKKSKHDGEPFDLKLDKAVEADLDYNYYRLEIPHSNRSIAKWYILTVLEDFLRGLFCMTKENEAAIVEFQVDRQRYSVRFALDRIHRECTDNSQVLLPSCVIPKLYSRSAELLKAGLDFMMAKQLFSAVHAGTARLKENEETVDIAFDEAVHDKRYAALELLGHLPLNVLDHSARLYAWVRYDQFRPSVVGAIAESVQIVGQQVIYEYQLHLAVSLASEMMQQPSLIPDDWRFPWGGSYETKLLVNAMCVRCMYHWIAVHFGAGLNGLRGGGETSLLHVTTKARLIRDLQEMCSLGESVIRSFVQDLTYGYAVKTPDPALQPIVALGNGLIGIPCLLFLSSNYERNLLSLQTRIDSTAFNTMSKLSEDGMVRDLLKEVSSRWPLSKGNVTIRVGGEFEEIDLLVADPTSRTLLVCELRWMLGPGDPREVQHRKKVCREKVNQLSRKVKWLSPRTALALRVLGATVLDTNGWAVEGIVAIQNFGGTVSTNPKFPVMTTRLFVQGVGQAQSLRHFAAWSQSLNWLPIEDRHFRIVPNEIHLSTLSKHLVVPGIEKLCSLPTYIKYVKQSLKHSTTTS